MGVRSKCALDLPACIRLAGLSRRLSLGRLLHVLSRLRWEGRDRRRVSWTDALWMKM